MEDINTDYGFIELHRTFSELPKEVVKNDDADFGWANGIGAPLRWDDLINEYRVVILSEAGSGKTTEIRHIARKLRGDKKQAFFLRLEHIPDDFDNAFEEGTYKTFTEWLKSEEEGWLLLDSVDEARLRHPKDFERAIRKLSGRIQTAFNRTHIVITSRTTAWRPKTDLDLCVTRLPFEKAATRRVPQAADGDELGEYFEDVFEDNKGVGPAFKIVTLDDLTDKQIAVFAKARGVEGSKAFLEAVDRADAWSFTSRPQDLEELVDFWLDKSILGTGLEIMRNSVERRLTERDQDRADAQPLSRTRLHQGARLLAAATTLTHTPTIPIPDGVNSSAGIAAQTVLDDWDQQELASLLSRPVFDEAIYSTVRFHHRSVREYLTAEWFAGLLSRETSRRNIELLFFRNHYGLDVVVPSLRPILPWLALLDEKIRDRVYKVAPEIFFEGGDPSQLPLGIRREILRDVCENIASKTKGKSMRERSAIQRFADPDLTDDIRELIRNYSGNDGLTAFLLHMVWLGQLKDAKPEVMDIALSPTAEHFARMAAFKAVYAIGTDTDKECIRQNFLNETSELQREWLAELAEGVKPTEITVPWFLSCLEKVKTNEPYGADRLIGVVAEFVKSTDIELLPRFVTGFNRLLNMPPMAEHIRLDISEKNQWLLYSASKAVERLVLARHAASLASHALGVLVKVPTTRDYKGQEEIDIEAELPELVPAWPELNRALFWLAVEKARSAIDKTGDERITYHWQISAFSSLWRFEKDDFDYVAEEITRRDFLDDKLVALSVAFDLYVKAGRPRSWRERLKKLVGDSHELSDRLKAYLKPPAQSQETRRLKQQEAKWKRREEARRRQREKYHTDWKQWFNDNLEEAQERLRKKPGVLTNPIYYLFEQTRNMESPSESGTKYNWKTLIPKYGEDVAHFYKNGTVLLWRNHKPTLRSEGAPLNQTTYAVIIGLIGLEIEAGEDRNWTEGLSPTEVGLACRYASFELNGFPTWFPKLFEAHTEIVCEFLMQEINYELSIEKQGKGLNYILNGISWTGQWAWDELAPGIYNLLAKEPLSLSNLDNLLKIVDGSKLPDVLIERLASKKCRILSQSDHLARWFALWTGVSPTDAITALKDRIAVIDDQQEQTTFAMIYITQLLGGWNGEGAVTRHAFIKPEHLKTLLMLMLKYIRPDEDIERYGGGVYRPGLRNEAQRARNHLFTLLKQIPGKEAFVAITELATAYHEEGSGVWLVLHAKSKAEQDSDIRPWSPKQVKEFNDKMERTPRNHEELADLAVSRLFDLKDDLEQGDSSIAGLLQKVDHENEMRNYIGNELQGKASGRYSVLQEEELADGKKPDLRFHGVGFNGPVPVELKLADKWSGRELFDRLENQLCGDYLRDNRSNRGIFLLVYRGIEKAGWDVSNGKSVDFSGLIQALEKHWSYISLKFPKVEEVTVIGIDLTSR